MLSKFADESYLKSSIFPPQQVLKDI